MNSRQDHYLEALGVTRWRLRARDEVATEPPSQGTGPLAASPDEWAALERRVASCEACELHRGRKQTVFGTGSRSASWMVIGEGPGAEEDRRGEPFVGRAGKLLNAMLLAAGFRREQVYIANIVKCRPPANRDPRPEESAACSGYLNAQIALVRPALILAVGRVAAQNLLSVSEPLGTLRGRRFYFGSDPKVPVVVTYHPAYLLRSPSAKAKAWQDLKLALDITKLQATQRLQESSA